MATIAEGKAVPSIRHFLAKWRPIDAALLLLVLLLFVLMFQQTLRGLVARWSNDSNYSHGFFIPIISLILLFKHSLIGHDSNAAACGAMGKRELAIDGPSQVSKRQQALGFVFVTAGLLLSWFSTLVPSLVAESFALLAVLAGLVLVLCRRDQWLRARFPIFFLVFMIPWPAPLYSQVAFPLQGLVSTIAAGALNVVGVPALCTGNLIQLPGETMHVAESCSGIRQLTAFVALGIAAAALVDRPRWLRFALLMSAVPIAITVNVLRVVGTGLLIHLGKEDWTTGWLHDIEGVLMVVVGLALFRAVIAVLDWLVLPMPESEVVEPAPRVALGGTKT